MAINTELYNGDGTKRDFTVPSEILSKSHVRVDFFYDGVDHEITSNNWDVLSATVVFHVAPTSGYIVKITTSTDGSGLDTAPSENNIIVQYMTELLAIYADIDKLVSLHTDKATLDSLYADKATLDSIFADKTTIDTIYANMAMLQSIIDNLVLLGQVEADATYVREAREAMVEPTGYNLAFPDELGILELAVEDPVDNTKYYIYGIDENNDLIATRNELKIGSLWGDGTAIDYTKTHQLAQYPVDGITPITWWIAGTKYTRDTIEILTLTPVSGKHFFYRDEIGLKETTTFHTDILESLAYTSSIYGNASDGLKIVFANERHGINMPGASHKLHHMTEGTEYVSGYGLVGLASGSGVYTQIDSGRYMDEDIDRITPIQFNSPFWHIEGAVWTGANDGLLLAHITTTRPDYNLNTAGTWSIVEIANSKFCLIHFFATNDVEFPVVKILGQNEYNNSTDARNGALAELQTLELAGLPAEEYVPLYTIILDSSGNLVLTDSGDLYVDWRQLDITASAGSGDTLPSQAGNDNKFLQTNGSVPAWIDIDVYLGTVYEGV